MSNVVNVNFKLDADDKKRMEKACEAMGLSMSTAFTIFAKKVGRECKIPFEVSADPFYIENNVKHLKESMSQIKEGKTVEKTLEELEKMANE